MHKNAHGIKVQTTIPPMPTTITTNEIQKHAKKEQSEFVYAPSEQKTKIATTTIMIIILAAVTTATPTKRSKKV